MLQTYCRMQLNVMCNLSYATTQICSCMCRMQLNFSYKRQLQNPKFLVVFGGEQTSIKACNVITWNFFTTLKAHLVWDLVIEVALV